MRVRTLTATLAALAIAVVMTACSGAPSTPPPATAAHDPADVAFVAGMIPHHRQAVTMSSLVASRSTSPQVRDLATRIEGAQGPEIEQMTGLLTTWGEPASGAAGPMGPMNGMLTDGQVQQLGTLSGPAFDRAYLELMTAHHRGAIDMARTELVEGRSPQAIELARAIITAQQAEIDEMAALLGRG